MSHQIMTPERIAEFRDAIANHPHFGIGGDALSKILDALESAQAEIAVDAGRLRDAAMRVWGEDAHGCDTPDRLADAILGLRAQIADLKRGGVVVPELTEDCPRVEQTILHVPGVSRGNCFAATVAGLLKLPIDAIPQFKTEGDISWQEQFNGWLRQFGLAWLPLAGDDLAGECQQFGITGLWSEMSGKSPRFDVGHSCVAKDGRLAWDPHPEQTGLERPIWWHGVFIALRPWDLASRLRPIPADRVLREEEARIGMNELQMLRCFAGRHMSEREYDRLEAVRDAHEEALRAQPTQEPAT